MPPKSSTKLTDEQVPLPLSALASALPLEQGTIGPDDIGLHCPEPHQHISQRFCLIGHIGFPGQYHSGNLDAIVSLGDLLEEGFAVLWPDQFSLIALIDQIHIDDNHPAVVGIVLLQPVTFIFISLSFTLTVPFSKSISHLVISTEGMRICWDRMAWSS